MQVVIFGTQLRGDISQRQSTEFDISIEDFIDVGVRRVKPLGDIDRCLIQIAKSFDDKLAS